MNDLTDIDTRRTDPPRAAPGHSTIELVLNAIERLAVVGAISWVWAAGKLDPTIAVVALLAVVGVSMGERRLKSGKSGGASIVLAVAGVAASWAPGFLI